MLIADPKTTNGHSEVRLDDKYSRDSGRVYLTGIQAMVRLPLIQSDLDRRAGLNTAGFISGYRGSPLAGYDLELTRAAKHLKEAGVVFQPGLNEELAATAVWGTQQLGALTPTDKDGVFAAWYGKGPGVDRAGDAFKHANAAGSSKHGGVLVFLGDDHAAESSTLAFQSEHAMIAAMIPVLNPANVQDYLSFGLLGWAMSRYSGCWIAFKALNDTVNSSASVAIDLDRIAFKTPEDFTLPEGGLNMKLAGLSGLVEAEQRQVRERLVAAQAFARANGVDRMVLDTDKPRLGIVTTGKAYLDVLQALDDLGFTPTKAREAGIRLYKVGLSWPLDPVGARKFAEGLDEIVVVEEKRPIVEEQLARILYNQPNHPRILGKTDEAGASLLPADGVLMPSIVGPVLADRIARIPGETDWLKDAKTRRRNAAAENPDERLPTRAPYYCSGCPHNTSTRVPEGSIAMGGIGCHTMALLMPERHTYAVTQMGGEGANWIGQAPFCTTGHVFQNLGDGTYFHSGLLAIRAAVAADVNITFKILYNDAVAMTGGQALDGTLTVAALTQQVYWEGVGRIVVVTDDVDRRNTERKDFAPGVEVHHRRELTRIQTELAETRGTTVLIYDQGCAAELRRKRKRGLAEDPDRRVFINPLVCEGCGDCNEVSTCVSVEPLETEFGRKRTINQSTCNKDYSCVEGYCPSFVSVLGGELARHEAVNPPAALAALPAAGEAEFEGGYSVLITGIGGTGVVTVGALLGMAAHLDGKGVSVLDMHGLAQKNGAVTSHVRVRHDTFRERPVRIPIGGADLVLACDMLVAAGPAALELMKPGTTRAVVNSHFAATGAFQSQPDLDFHTDLQRRAIEEAVGEGRTDLVDAAKLCEAVMGDAITTNVFILGFAVQRGLLPVSLASLERAIELNGVAVADNLRAFAWGRLAATDLAAVQEAARPFLAADVETRFAETLDEITRVRAEFLTAYQNRALARKYLELVGRVHKAETERASGKKGLAEAVARYYFKLLAYKDEYEVARLHTQPEFLANLRQGVSGKARLRFHLSPQFLPADRLTGRPRKFEFGAWILPLFRVLARGKRLRGTIFDPFGYMRERRMERQLIREYEGWVETILASLSAETHASALALASLPERIRGYGDIKRAGAEAVGQEAERLRAGLATV